MRYQLGERVCLRKSDRKGQVVGMAMITCGKPLNDKTLMGAEYIVQLDHFLVLDDTDKVYYSLNALPTPEEPHMTIFYLIANESELCKEW